MIWWTSEVDIGRPLSRRLPVHLCRKDPGSIRTLRVPRTTGDGTDPLWTEEPEGHSGLGDPNTTLELPSPTPVLTHFKERSVWYLEELDVRGSQETSYVVSLRSSNTEEQKQKELKVRNDENPSRNQK